MNFLKIISLIFISSFFIGCQTVVIKDEMDASFSFMGEANFEKERQIRKDFKQSLEKQASIENDSIKVLIDAIPEGITYNDGLISVKEGYQHEIVGKFTVVRNLNDLFWQQYWMMDYESSTANILCNAQAPFKILTLGLWMYSPTYWLCWPEFKYTPEQAKTDVARLAQVAGGDLVITNFIKIIPSDVDDDIIVISMSGFILKLDPKMKKDKIKTSPQQLKEASSLPRA